MSNMATYEVQAMGFSGSLVVQLSRVQRKLHDETAREPTKLEIDAKRRDDNENLKSKLEKKTKDADVRKQEHIDRVILVAAEYPLVLCSDSPPECTRYYSIRDIYYNIGCTRVGNRDTALEEDRYSAATRITRSI